MQLRRATAWLGLAVCVMALAAGCGDDALDALQSDPMATESIDGVEEVDVAESEGSSGGVIGKPAPAYFQRTFAAPTDAVVQRAFEEALSKSEKVGWEISSVSPFRDGFVAEREVDGHSARLTVSVIDDPDLGPVPGLSISLSATVE